MRVAFSYGVWFLHRDASISLLLGIFISISRAPFSGFHSDRRLIRHGNCIRFCFTMILRNSGVNPFQNNLNLGNLDSGGEDYAAHDNDVLEEGQHMGGHATSYKGMVRYAIAAGRKENKWASNNPFVYFWQDEGAIFVYTFILHYNVQLFHILFEEAHLDLYKHHQPSVKMRYRVRSNRVRGAFGIHRQGEGQVRYQ